MDLKKLNHLGFAGVMLSSSMALAGTMGPVADTSIHPVITLFGGYASINAGNSSTFTGADTNIFTYSNSGNGKNTGFIGGFLGAERALPWMPYPGFVAQVGVEYSFFGSVGVSGTNKVGIEPQTSTTYTYNYAYQPQQVLVFARLFGTMLEKYHPYGEVGLGAAFNNLSNYSTATIETGSINLTPLYANSGDTQFSYSLGVGVDTQVTNNVSVGLGYRFSNFGSAYLGDGQIVMNQYTFPVPFNLGSSQAYANQLIARISYVA